MNSNFIFDRPVTGKDFIGRKSECDSLAACLQRFESAAVYGPPRIGKSSLIMQTFRNMRMSHQMFDVLDVDMLPVRTLEQFCSVFGEAVIRLYASTPDEISALTDKYLAEGGMNFNQSGYASDDTVLTFSKAPDLQTLRLLLMLPFRLADDSGRAVYIHLRCFQNVLFFEDCDAFLKCLVSCLNESASVFTSPKCAYVFNGSAHNAMKSIFDRKHIFGKSVNVFTLNAVEQNAAVPEISRKMLSSGKVLDQQSAAAIYNFFRGNIGIINHFCSLCDFLSRGYVQDMILQEALSLLLGTYEPVFESMVSDLTSYQVSLLKAILDGNVRLGSAEMIRKYGLNSSANVKRLKDALVKKEIISFDRQDVPYFLNHLFEIWLDRRYFKSNKIAFL